VPNLVDGTVSGGTWTLTETANLSSAAYTRTSPFTLFAATNGISITAAVCRLSTGVSAVMVVYNRGVFRIFTRNGSSWDIGPALNQDEGTVYMCKLSATSFAFYGNTSAKIYAATISGTGVSATITVGTGVSPVFNSGRSIHGEPFIWAASASAFNLIATGYNGAASAVNVAKYTVSGTTVTAGAIVDVYISGAADNNLRVYVAPVAEVTDQAVIVYTNGDSNNTYSGITWNAGAVVGSAHVLSSTMLGNTTYPIVWATSTKFVLVLFQNSVGNWQMCNVDVNFSTGAFTINTLADLSFGGATFNLGADGTRKLTIFNDASNVAYMGLLTTGVTGARGAGTTPGSALLRFATATTTTTLTDVYNLGNLDTNGEQWGFACWNPAGSPIGFFMVAAIIPNTAGTLIGGYVDCQIGGVSANTFDWIKNDVRPVVATPIYS
jgi:hypothetical protein